MPIQIEKLKYWAHRSNSIKKNVAPLTYEQYLLKIKDAGISAHDIGNKKGKYQLARYGDVGDYTPESCRFITKEKNMLELIENGGFVRGAAKKKGRTKLDHPGLKLMSEKNSKPFIIKSPSGEIFSGKNLHQFCKDNGLDSGNMNRVLNGIKKHFKGWTKP